MTTAEDTVLDTLIAGPRAIWGGCGGERTREVELNDPELRAAPAAFRLDWLTPLRHSP